MFVAPHHWVGVLKRPVRFGRYPLQSSPALPQSQLGSLSLHRMQVKQHRAQSFALPPRGIAWLPAHQPQTNAASLDLSTNPARLLNYPLYRAMQELDNLPFGDRDALSKEPTTFRSRQGTAGVTSDWFQVQACNVYPFPQSYEYPL